MTSTIFVCSNIGKEESVVTPGKSIFPESPLPTIAWYEKINNTTSLQYSDDDKAFLVFFLRLIIDRRNVSHYFKTFSDHISNAIMITAGLFMSLLLAITRSYFGKYVYLIFLLFQFLKFYNNWEFSSAPLRLPFESNGWWEYFFKL